MKNKKILKIVFIVIFVLLCIIPSVGMAVSKQDTTSENRVLAAFPEFITEEGEFNVNFLSEFGEYFDDHFAFRKMIVAADSLIQSKLFGVSSVESVIVGTEQWLYYKDTLDNYKGQNLLSQRAKENIVHNISLMSEYTADKGSEFIVAIAPNKNALYGENMPYYLRSKVSQTNDAKTVQKMLSEKGVKYVDLFELFENEEEVLYFKGDSHWNTMGAHLVYNVIMSSLNLKYNDYSDCEIKTNENFIGDLYKMVYPLSSNGEEDRYYDYKKDYTVISPDESPEAHLIVCANEKQTSSLLMYRDSFGNSLYPIFANAFSKAVFSKATPYNFSLNFNTYSPEYVVVEKVQRNLSDFAFYPPVFPSVKREAVEEFTVNETEIEFEASVCETNTMLAQITGFIPEDVMSDGSNVFVKLSDSNEFFECFSLSSDESDYGFKFITEKDRLSGDKITAEIFVENSGEYTKVSTIELNEKDFEEVLL